jgi:hypothetical protein
VVQDAVTDLRALGNRERVDRLLRLQQPQQMECAVEDADFGVRGDDDRLPSGHRHGTHDVTLGAGVAQVGVETEGSDHRRLRWNARNHDAVPRDAGDDWNVPAKQARQPALQLGRDRLRRGRPSLDEHLADRGLILLQPRRIRDAVIPQP